MTRRLAVWLIMMLPVHSSYASMRMSGKVLAYPLNGYRSDFDISTPRMPDFNPGLQIGLDTVVHYQRLYPPRTRHIYVYQAQSALRNSINNKNEGTQPSAALTQLVAESAFVDVGRSEPGVSLFDGQYQRRLSDIEPIHESRWQRLRSDRLIDLIEEPLLPAMRRLLRMNIVTTESSANKTDLTREYRDQSQYVGFSLAVNNLSWVNKKIALQVIPQKFSGVRVEETDADGGLIGIFIRIEGNPLVADISRIALLIAREFRPQDPAYTSLLTVKELARIYATHVSKIIRELRTFGYFHVWKYDPHTQLVYADSIKIGQGSKALARTLKKLSLSESD